MKHMTSLRTRNVLRGLAAVALVCSVAAQAQPHQAGPQHAPGGYPGGKPVPQYGGLAPRPMPEAQMPGRPPMPQPHMGHQKNPPPPHAMHGAGPDRRWVRGAKVPPQYRTKHYVVNDWKRHGLQRPGRGQHWIQYGGDYVLVSIASGVIAQLILGH